MFIHVRARVNCQGLSVIFLSRPMRCFQKNGFLEPCRSGESYPEPQFSVSADEKRQQISELFRDQRRLSRGVLLA
jgi:hypothetical protein